jgi:hypothetical protein
MAELISDWGFQINHSTLNRQWNKFQNGLIGNNRENCGRERVIGMDTKNKMIEEVLSNRFTTAADLYQDENINHN